MAPVQITMAGGRYDRTRALVDGSVKPEGVDLQYIEMPIEEVFWRVLLFEHDYGVPPSAMRWHIGGIEQPNRSDRMNVRINADVDIQQIPDGACLNGMLEAGKIHALMGPRIPSAYRKRHPDVTRLFPDYKMEERKYYERIRMVPIMHLVVMKRSVFERAPWVAQSIFKAFRESTRRCYEMMLDVNALPYSLPWYLPALEETLEVFGEDFWPEGFEANWRNVETLMSYAKEQGLIDRIYKPEELFAPNTLTEFKI